MTTTLKKPKAPTNPPAKKSAVRTSKSDRLDVITPRKIPVPDGGPGTGQGRPSEYREIYNEIAYNMSLLGLTMAEIAKVFGVEIDTVWGWKRRYPKFHEAILEGRDFADARVARAFYEKAIGYEHTVEKVAVARDGTTTKYEVVEKYPPDTKAGIIWLSNRQPGRWHERVEVTGKDGGPIDAVNTVITISDPTEAAKIYAKLIGGV